MAYADIEYKLKKLGKNSHIGRNVYFRYPELVEIGNNVIIDEFCLFTTAMKIEDYVSIDSHTSVIGGRDSMLIMRDFSGLSCGARIVCGTDDYLGDGLMGPKIPLKYRAGAYTTTVEFKKHSVLGTECVVHPGVTVGEGATTGSMTLITKDLEPWWVYLGQPAKKHKRRDKTNVLLLEKQFRADIQFNK
jgi:acetyltransferase-like isoleucine patch superfamily enzyme